MRDRYHSARDSGSGPEYRCFEREYRFWGAKPRPQRTLLPRRLRLRVLGLPELLDGLRGQGSGDLCLAPGESYLIMTPTLPGGRGRGDLHVSFRQPDGSWGEFTNLGDSVNTAAHEWCPMVTPEGKHLFFSRYFGKFGKDWGDGGDGEVYWVDTPILDQFRPKAANGNTKRKPQSLLGTVEQ